MISLIIILFFFVACLNETVVSWVFGGVFLFFWICDVTFYLACSIPLYLLEITFYFWFTFPASFKMMLQSCYDFLAALDPWNYIISQFKCAPPQTWLFFFEQPQSRYCFLVNRLNGVQPVLSTLDARLLLFFTFASLVSLIILIYFSFGVNCQMRVQEFVMSYLLPFSTQPALKPEIIRSRFMSQPIAKLNLVPDHTHAQSAGDRSRASAFIDAFGPVLGLVPFFVQTSRSDERKGRMGSRVPFWSKDLNTHPAPFSPPANPLFAMVDVDHHVDMPSFLCDNFAPLIMYTFQPSSVARISSEYCFTFNARNEVTYRVTGGGCYHHMVWSYAPDNILVVKTFCFVPYKIASYCVDRRCTSEDHEIVLLTPLALWTGFKSVLVRMFLSGVPLERLQVANGKFTRMLVFTKKDGLVMSTGHVDSYAVANVPADVDETLSTIARSSKYDLSLPQATSHTEGDKVAGAVAMDYHRSQQLEVKPPVVCPVSESVRAYHSNPVTYDPSDKLLLRPFMRPFLLDCFVPTNTLATEENAVAERVVNVRPAELPQTPFITMCLKEFVEFLIPLSHQLSPVDYDYLMRHQTRPAQRRIIEVSQGLDPNRICESFLKKEPYVDVKPGRLISKINGPDKVQYSLFIYALTECVLKLQEWYAFGRSPREIAERIAKICQNASSHVTNSDFSKFDGHCSNLVRDLERMVLLRAFRHEFHETLIDLHESQYRLKAYTTRGVKYDTCYARLSGSPETSTFNGITNAFVSYLERRSVREDGTCYTAEQAWNALGIYGGDDGVTADADSSTYVRAAAMIGQVLTAEQVFRDTLGVKFLARVYSPFVWQGDVNTCCDLPRQLTKLHVTVNLAPNVTPTMKLLEKLRAFWLTDSNTPYIGELTERGRFLLQSDYVTDERTAQIRPWNSELPREKQYVNDAADWMMEYAQSVLPNANRKLFLEWLNSTKSLEDLLSPSTLQEETPAKPKDPVVVNGEELPRRNVRTQRKTPSDPVERTPEEFERWKAEKIKAGTWVDKKPSDVSSPLPNLSEEQIKSLPQSEKPKPRKAQREKREKIDVYTTPEEQKRQDDLKAAGHPSYQPGGKPAWKDRPKPDYSKPLPKGKEEAKSAKPELRFSFDEASSLGLNFGLPPPVAVSGTPQAESLKTLNARLSAPTSLNPPPIVGGVKI